MRMRELFANEGEENALSASNEEEETILLCRTCIVLCMHRVQEDKTVILWRWAG